MWLRKWIAVALILACAACASAARLVWDANTESDLAGYKIHYGLASRQYTNTVDVGNVTEWPIPTEWPRNQDYYFAATAYDNEVPVLESGYSNETVYYADEQPPVEPPAQATDVRITFQQITPEPQMAIAWTQLTEGYSTSNPASTASISPTANRQVFVAVALSVQGGYNTREDDTITVSGCGLTWTEVGANKSWGARRGLYVWRGVSASPSSGALTITFTSGVGATFEQMKWSVDEASGVDSTTPVGTAYVADGAAVQALSVTVSETPAAGDVVYAAFALEDNNAPSLGSELDSTLTNFGDATGARRFVVAYDSSPDSTPVPGITWTGSCFAGGVAFIITNAAAGGSSIVPLLLHQYRARRQ